MFHDVESKSKKLDKNEEWVQTRECNMEFYENIFDVGKAVGEGAAKSILVLISIENGLLTQNQALSLNLI